MIGIDSYNRSVEPTEAVHAAFFGMTGMGKTTLIEHYLDTGKGFILFDCEGESSDRIHAMIPRHRTNDVIYIDPLADRVPGISFLSGRDRAIREQNVVHFFRNNWASSWGARSEWLIANLTYVLLAAESAPLYGFASLSKEIGSTSFRDRLGKDVDLFGKQFLKYFKSLTPTFRQEVVMPILNKVDMLVRNEHCRVIFGQSDSSFSFAEAMDRQQIIIVRIPAGELGDMTRLIGSAIFTLITREALLRKKRDPYLLILDELQEYTQGIDLGRVLATTRKYGLFALMAVTNMEQIDDQTLAAMLANSGTIAAFRTSARDAERLAKELGTDMQPRAIQELQQFSCLYAKRGERLPSSPVIVQVEPPREINTVRGERIRRASLRRWGRPRAKVLERVERYLA